MLTNRSMPVASVIPVLGYRDVPAAAAWLCDRFGARERLRIGRHRVQMTISEGAFVVAEAEEPGRAGAFSLMVRVADVEAHFRHALARGVTMLEPPTYYPYGEKQYSAEDLAGHVWTFSQTFDDVDPAAWGGELIRPA